MIRVFHPGSGSWILILTFYPSQMLILDPRFWIEGSKGTGSQIPDLGSRSAKLEISDLLWL
jgi:hypothetical protein